MLLKVFLWYLFLKDYLKDSVLAANYYGYSFFWNSLSKILKALIDFISVPILLKSFGIENYGVLTLATAANTYMRILDCYAKGPYPALQGGVVDLGLNVSIISCFSKWRMAGEYELINIIAGTNIGLVQ